MASRLTSVLCLLICLLASRGYAQDTLAPPEPVSVILLIGNGLGTAQVSSAFYYGEETSHFARFQRMGLVNTSSASHTVTDPAAAATAMATGVQTYNRAIAYGPDTVPVPSILEQLRYDEGYKTGLVSLTSITHASTASFYAHAQDRDHHEDIASQLATSGVDFFAGGGLNYFTHRKDGRNLYRELEGKGYHLDTIGLSPTNINRKNGYLLAPESLPTKAEGRQNFLPDATRVGLDYFSRQESPFFFVLEGPYIDRAGHAQSDTLLMQEMADFDATLGILLDYVDAHPNTLLVVAGNHETGGLRIGKRYESTLLGPKREIPTDVALEFSTREHSAGLVPIFARGPGEEHFSGIYPNNEIYHRLLKALNSGKEETAAR
ncbi:alkaline phosphatase [Lewinella sp. IMCC34191]|uniref:alkaline phosphatase n=1 Tax=Lewinella sp. IMCC34191 TaxID=2259172 RepID=UPI000E24F558|nr:alkaline phosphatase [Lewinella sp. IMCC34191]